MLSSMLDRTGTRNFLVLKDQSDTSGMFWRHIARRAATNPSGTVLPRMSCSAIDQGEYVYDWKKTRSDHMQCEFVEFRPI